MAIDEQSRIRLYEAVREVLGEREAVTLMEYLPPVGWGDVATKHDLAALRSEVLAALHSEIGTVRSEIGTVVATLHAEIGTVRGELGTVRGDLGALHAEIGTVRGELGTEIGALRAEMHDTMREQTNRLMMWMIPTWLSGIGLAVAVSQLG